MAGGHGRRSRRRSRNGMSADSSWVERLILETPSVRSSKWMGISDAGVTAAGREILQFDLEAVARAGQGGEVDVAQRLRPPEVEPGGDVTDLGVQDGADVAVGEPREQLPVFTPFLVQRAAVDVPAADHEAGAGRQGCSQQLRDDAHRVAAVRVHLDDELGALVERRRHPGDIRASEAVLVRTVEDAHAPASAGVVLLGQVVGQLSGAVRAGVVDDLQVQTRQRQGHHQVRHPGEVRRLVVRGHDDGQRQFTPAGRQVRDRLPRCRNMVLHGFSSVLRQPRRKGLRPLRRQGPRGCVGSRFGRVGCRAAQRAEGPAGGRASVAASRALRPSTTARRRDGRPARPGRGRGTPATRSGAAPGRRRGPRRARSSA